MKRFLQKLIEKGRELSLENNLEVESERILTGNETFDAILNNTNFGFYAEEVHLSKYGFEFYSINVVKDVQKMSRREFVMNLINESRGFHYLEKRDSNLAHKIVDAVQKEKANCDVGVMTMANDEYKIAFELLPASQEDTNKYVQFINKLKAIQLPDLEKVAVICGMLSMNKGTKQHIDPDEEYAIRKKEITRKGIMQKVYAPATIFSGTKSGVCLDRAYALVDICSNVEINAHLVDSSVKIKEKNAPGHVWARIEIPETEGDSFRFDLDMHWYKQFKMLIPRIEKTKSDKPVVKYTS
jgi:hypothetical protein